MSSVTAIAGAAALALLAGCHRAPSYPAGTPAAALASFEKAINAGRIPGDLYRLVANDTERQRWKLRCKTFGCAKAHFRVVGTRNMSSYRAVLWVDYEVDDKEGNKVVHGKHLAVSFERDNNRWMIDRFGDVPPEETPADAGVPAAHAPAPPADAAAKQADAAP